jgi:hypothetical protein
MYNISDILAVDEHDFVTTENETFSFSSFFTVESFLFFVAISFVEC